MVPFHGEIEERYLTNKQKRRLATQKKFDANPVTSRGGLGKDGGKFSQVTKSASDIKKQRKKDINTKMKNSAEFRKARATQLKKQFYEKQEMKMLAKQSRPRSFKIWVGGKKDAPTKKLEKRARTKKGTTFLK